MIVPESIKHFGNGNNRIASGNIERNVMLVFGYQFEEFKLQFHQIIVGRTREFLHY